MLTYFIIGASGSGKTTVIPFLQQQLSTKWNIYDFDSIGVPASPDKQWRQRATEQWLERLRKETQNTILTGQMVLGEIISCPSAEEFSNIHVIFLDCYDTERIKRLKKRERGDATQDTLHWASWLRMHHTDPQWAPHVITDNCWSELQCKRWLALENWKTKATISYVDSTALSPQEVARKIANVIQHEESNQNILSKMKNHL